MSSKGTPIPTPLPDDPSLVEAGEPTAPRKRALGLLGLLIELIVPVALSAGFLLAMAGYTRRWDLRTPFGLASFGVLLVVLSLLVSLRVDSYTLGRRQEMGRRQLLNRADPRSRLVKLALGGVVIPVAAFAAANLVELRNHQTPMAMAASYRVARPDVDRPEQLAAAILRTESPGAKAQGILALQAMGSPESLDQLLRITSGDPALLRSGSTYRALARALASYGDKAKPKLLQHFTQIGLDERRAEAAPPGDLFERYFSADFAGVKSEIEARTPDPAVRAGEQDRIQAAQAQLRLALSQVESDTRPIQGGGGVASVILQAFLEMNLKRDADVLALARQTAADDSWPESVRGQALLLIARLGGQDDLELLYGYLESPSRLLQARAMEAIASLQSKLAAAANNG